MDAHPPVAARATRRFDASPERVFDAWLDLGSVRAWLVAARENTTLGPLLHLEREARVGGSYTVVETIGDLELLTTGEYLEIDRPRRLVFSYARPQLAPEADRVVVEIVPVGTGCELTVTQEVHPNRARNAGRAAALWAFFLDAIAGVLGEDGGQADPDDA